MREAVREAARERRKDERGREKRSEGEKERREIEVKIGTDRERQIERNVLYECVSV